MTLSIGSSLTGGFRRIANRNGLLLILAYVVVGVVWQMAFYSAFAAWVAANAPEQQLALPTIGGPLAVLAVGAVVSLLALQYLTIVAIRTLVSDHTRSIPSEYVTRNAVLVLVNTILVGIAYGMLVTLGTIAIIVPGIIAYVAFTFGIFFVAVEDENFVAALRDSWSITRGNWIRLFVLHVVLLFSVGLVGGILSMMGRLIVGAAVGEGIGVLVSGTLNLPFSLLVLSVLADAFTQLRDEP